MGVYGRCCSGVWPHASRNPLCSVGKEASEGEEIDMGITSDDLNRAMDIISWHCKSKAETWIPLANKIAQALAEERKRTLESEVVKGLVEAFETVSSYLDGCGCCSSEEVKENEDVIKALAAYHAAIFEKEEPKV